jgi:hypothetical protein
MLFAGRDGNDDGSVFVERLDVGPGQFGKLHDVKL